MREFAGAAMLFAVVVLSTALAGAQERPNVEVVPLLIHSSEINSAAFSPDAARVVTGSTDGTAKLWDTATGRLIRTFDDHSGSVSAVAFSADGTHILTAGRRTRLWNAATGQPIATIETGQIRYPSQAALSADSALLLSGGSPDGAAKLWDVATGRLIRTFQHGGEAPERDQVRLVTAVAFSPDGGRALTGGPAADSIAKLWDVATGRLLQEFGKIGPHREWVALAFSPDGARVATSGNYKETLKLWDAATGKRLFADDRDCQSLAFTRDGSAIMGNAKYGGLTFWDAASGEVIKEKHQSWGSLGAVSGDGASVLEVSRRSGAFVIWDDQKKGLPVQFWDESVVTAGQIAISANGGRIVSEIRKKDRGPGAVVQWEAQTGRLVSGRIIPSERRGYPETTVYLTPDGSGYLNIPPDSRDQPAKAWELWDVETPTLLRTFEGANRTHSLIFAQNGSHVLSCCDPIAVWEVAKGGQPSRRFEFPGNIAALSLSGDGSRVAVGDDEEVVKVWDTATGRLLRSIDPRSWWRPWSFFSDPRARRQITKVAFSPDGKQILAGREWWGWENEGKTIKLWDVTTGRLIHAFDVEHANGRTTLHSLVTALAFSPDATRILSVHGGLELAMPAAAMLRLWDTATGRLLREAEADHVTSIMFSHDGRQIISGENDGAIRIRDTQSGELVATLISLIGQPSRPATEENIAARDPPAAERESRAKLTNDELQAYFEARNRNYLAALGNEWLVVTPEGFFDASSQATATRMLSIVRGLELFDVGRNYEVLHRPDLVRAKLAGDPEGKVKAASGGLEARLELK